MEREVATEPCDLCRDCGMCCGGHLFTYLALTESDRDRLSDAGFGDAAAQDRLELPCRFLEGVRCSIYASRPAACASYRCKTLAQAQDGAISLSEAKERLNKVARLRQAFEAAIPGELSVAEANALAKREPMPGQPMVGHYLPLRLAFVALQQIIDRYLREDRDAIVGPRGD